MTTLSPAPDVTARRRGSRRPFDPAEGYSIKQAARLAGTTTRTLRYYVGRGLIEEPERTAAGNVYSEAHLVRLLRLRQLTAMGLSLDDAAEALGPPGGAPSADLLRELDQRLADRVTEIEEQRRLIAELLGG